MPAAVCQVVVSLSVERTSLQTRAGDVHGHHPSASAAERVRVRVCIGAGLEGGGGARDLKRFHFLPIINILST